MIRLEVRGGKELKFKLLNIERGAVAKGLMMQLLTAVDIWVQRNFKTQGGNVGGWTPFAQSTLRSMPKRRRPAKLLQDKGTLRSKWDMLADDKGRGIFRSATFYGLYHHYGIPGKLPARQIIPNEGDIGDRVQKIWARHLKGIVNQ